MATYHLGNKADVRRLQRDLKKATDQSGLTKREFNLRMRAVMPMIDALVDAMREAGCEPPDVMSMGPEGFAARGKNWTMTTKKTE